MNNIYENIKRKVLRQAKSILPQEVQEELGIKKFELNEKIRENCKDSQIGFFQPIDSQLLNTQEAQKVRSGSIVIISILIAFLLFLFFKLIIPSDSYLNGREGITMIDGNTVRKEIHKVIKKSKINEISEIPVLESDLKVEDIKVSTPKPLAQEMEEKAENNHIAKIEEERAKALAEAKKAAATINNSSNTASSNIKEYRVRNGDSLAVIAQRVYGSASPSNIEKLKRANNIRNPRSLRAGQKLKV